MILLTAFIINGAGHLHARELINLSLDSAVDIAMKNSYRIKQLELGIDRTRLYLKAERASLKSRVYLNLIAPEYDAVAENKWNSTLRKDEIIRQDTRRWQMDLSVRQPVVLLGYPTNGYLSLNNKVYQYLQKEDGDNDIDYYNRFFVKFEQPIFRPNNLKNDIEQAELNLKREELSYIRDRVNLVNEVSHDFYDLFHLFHRDKAYNRIAEDLEKVYDIAQAAARKDTTRAIEEIQARVELSNAREMLMKNQSELRLQRLRMKQRLRLDVGDSLHVEHSIILKDIVVDFDQALRYGYTLRPHLQLLKIEKRRREIQLNESHGWDAFHLNFEVTFGFENNQDRYQAMWGEYDNSYSISFRTYIPLWDWGRRKAWIGGETVNLRRAELNIEENLDSIKNNLNTTVTNLEDYQQRAIRLEKSLEVAYEICDLSIEQYRVGNISFNDVLQVIDSHRETELNFIDAYIGYRRTMQSLKSLTFYDYEDNMSMIDKYKPGS